MTFFLVLWNERVCVCFRHSVPCGPASVAQVVECRPTHQEVTVRSPVRTPAWVVGSVPSRGRGGGNQRVILSQQCFSLPPTL